MIFTCMFAAMVISGGIIDVSISLGLGKSLVFVGKIPAMWLYIWEKPYCWVVVDKTCGTIVLEITNKCSCP